MYTEFYFVDRGEPGTRDVIRAFFTYDATFRLDANSDPDVFLTECNSGVVITEGCNDRGIIQNGNVQILPNADRSLHQTRVLGTV